MLSLVKCTNPDVKDVVRLSVEMVKMTLCTTLKETKMFLPHPRVKVSIVGSLRDREVACSASDRQGSNFESCVWRTVSSQSSHHPQEVLLAQFSLYVHKGGLKPDSFHFIYDSQELTTACIYLNATWWQIGFHTSNQRHGGILIAERICVGGSENDGPLVQANRRRWPNVGLMLVHRLWSWLNINPLSAGTVFRRQNLTYLDVIFWRLKSIPALKQFNYIIIIIYNGCRPIT